MDVKILESVEAAPTRTGNKWLVRVIEAGKGSSGVYTEALLERSAPIFAVGTQVYLDHPGENESFDRPERSVRDLVGRFVSEARYENGALYAEVQFYSDYANLILERAEDIGMSIRAAGVGTQREDGEFEITEFLEVHSVDVVTKAGAGGALIALLESARERVQDVSNDPPIEESKMNEEQEALLRQVADTLATLAKPEAPAPVEESEQVDPLAVAEALSVSNLSERGRKAVVEALRGGAELEAAVADQEAYETELAEAARTARRVDEQKVEESTGRKISWTGGTR